MIRLASPPGTAAPFAVQVEDRDGVRRITIDGTDPDGARRTRRYDLPVIDQNAYLDMFAAIAADFGTRLPRNRQPAPVRPARLSCEPLLTEHLSEDILYGYGDPAVLRVEEAEGPAFYLVATSNDAPHAFPLLRSSNLKDWSLVRFIFPEGEKPAWVAEGAQVSDLWAPELHKVGDRFLLCFTAREHDGSLSIGIASAATPAGPYSFSDRPLLAGGVIDSHILPTEDGPLLFWKEDTNGVWPRLLARMLHERVLDAAALFDRDEDLRTAALTQTLWPWIETLPSMEQFFLLQPLIEAATDDFPSFRARLERQRDEASGSDGVAIDAILRTLRTSIYAQPLSPDGSALFGEKTEVLANDLPWEAHLIEGVWVSEHRGRYYLFYAGNDFSTADYGIGVAVADAPLGPYRKAEQPLLRSAEDWWGPGHPSVAIGPDATPRMFFHAFFPGRAGYKAFRAVLGIGVDYRDDHVRLIPWPGDEGGSL